MNLSYLQRLDAGVESIAATAGHVALYDFDAATSQWSRKDVEGSLFLVRMRDARFRFVILNKKGDSGDYWEDVGEGFSCEKQEPYVMYKKGRGVVGIWFYEERDCGKFAALFEEISKERREVPPASGQALLGLLKDGGARDASAHKARALLENLARNGDFCRILGDEMRRAGWA
jgi:mRNA-decapping enzyme 1B